MIPVYLPHTCTVSKPVEENEYGEPEQVAIGEYECLYQRVSRHKTDRLGHDVITDGLMIFDKDANLQADYWIEFNGETFSIVNIDMPPDAMGDISHKEVDLQYGKSISRGLGQ